MPGSPTPSSRRVLGIDPGLAVTGYGIVEPRGSGGMLVHSGSLRQRSTVARADRLARIFDCVRGLILEHHPDEVAIELQFVGENVRSAMSIGEARAAAMVAAATSGLPVFEYTPSAIKESVCGYGGAPKEQVQQMVLVHLGITELTGPLDVTDAIAIALTRLADARLEEAMAR